MIRAHHNTRRNLSNNQKALCFRENNGWARILRGSHNLPVAGYNCRGLSFVSP